jgi:hypothetical protein
MACCIDGHLQYRNNNQLVMPVAELVNILNHLPTFLEAIMIPVNVIQDSLGTSPENNILVLPV